ncbi:hypothetical protein JCM8547_008266 [Rhodosporidiobolus lusitaniae]
MNGDMLDDDSLTAHPFPDSANPFAAHLASLPSHPSRRRKGLPVHRCRFPDWAPASVTALALTPATFDAGLLGFGGSSGERGVLAVGRANGDVELMLWGGHQGWVAWRTLPSPFPLPKTRNSRKPTSLLSHLVFTHQATLSQADLDLYEGDREGAEQEMRRLKREGVRLFGVGGAGSELVEWEWGGPGSGKAVGMVKSTLPTLPPIFALAASRTSSCLAIACEDSTIRILNIMDGELELVSKIEVGGPGKVRALSLAWGPPVESPKKGKDRDSSPDASSLPPSFSTPSESYLVAGCSNSTIRRFDVPQSGSVVGIWRGGLKLTLDRLKGEHTIVWTVAVLADGTLVSGDSMGNVKFWDGEMGTQSQSFKAHKADVLALALGSDGTSLFTSGVDQKTTEFRLVTVASSRIHDVPAGRWIQASGRRLHSHDVRAIVISPPYSIPFPSSSASSSSTEQQQQKKPLVPVMTSGGLDLSLILTTVSPATSSTSSSSSKKRSTPLKNPISDVPSTEFESTTHRRAAYVPQRSRPFAVAAGGETPRLLVCRRDRGVGIWKLEDPKRSGGSAVAGGGNAAPLNRVRWGRKAFGVEEVEEEEEVGTTGYEKVAELELKLQTNLVSSAVSADGRWLAVSDLYETKLFRLQWRNGDLIPRRQKSFTAALTSSLPTPLGTGSSCLLFIKDPQRLVLSSAFGTTIAVVQLPEAKEDECEVVAVLGEGASKVKKVPNGLNGDGDVEMNGGAASSEESDEEDEEESSSPAQASSAKRVPSSIVCLAVSTDGKYLATAETDRRVAVYDLAAQKLDTTLPTPPLVPVSLTFTPPTTAGEPTLLVALPTNSLLLYGLTSHRFHPWGLPLSSKKYNTLMDIREPVLGVSFEPRRVDSAATLNGADESHIHPSRRASVHPAFAESSVAVVWGANWVAKLDLAALKRGDLSSSKKLGALPVENGKAAKKKQRKLLAAAAAAAPERREADRKRAREEEDDLPLATSTSSDLPSAGEPQPLDIKVTRRYQPLCLFDFVGQGELVAVERTWFDVAQTLPEAWVKAGQFGT